LEDFKIITGIFSSLASPIVAIVVAYIAYQQWKVNSNKEMRESNQNKLHVYLAVKRFLQSFDNTLEVDRKLHLEMQEALAIGDFIFDDTLNEWLNDIDSEASCWLDVKRIIDLAENERSGLELSPILEREEPHLEKSQEKLQQYHCELLGKFKEQLKM
jgi:hypothetical protein